MRVTVGAQDEKRARRLLCFSTAGFFNSYRATKTALDAEFYKSLVPRICLQQRAEKNPGVPDRSTPSIALKMVRATTEIQSFRIWKSLRWKIFSTKWIARIASHVYISRHDKETEHIPRQRRRHVIGDAAVALRAPGTARRSIRDAAWRQRRRFRRVKCTRIDRKVD